MTKADVNKYRDQLRTTARRLAGTAAALEEGARSPTGGDTSGNLSNAPMHLGDLGTDAYTQELNATLLENEDFIRREVNDAIDRIDRGTFGACENCGTAIPEGRLDILPYARYCVACAEKLESGVEVNLNAGRPASGADTMNPHDDGSEPVHFAGADRDDVHAAGTPGGGSAVGGLAGTNTGTGDPIDADLTNAMGSGNFDADLAGGTEQGFAGHAGGAVGGTPANKRATGGKARRGTAPRPHPDDAPGNP